MPKKQKQTKVIVEVKRKKMNNQLKVKPIPNVVAKLSNSLNRGMDKRSDATAQSAAAILHPFEAYEKQMEVGLPFDETAAPHFGFWTRDIQTVDSVTLTGGASGEGAFAVAFPWHTDCLSYGTVIAANGVITTVNNVPSVSAGFITSNFERAVVTHMGMRVRNLTAVLEQSGDITIGQAKFETVMSATGAQRRLNQLSYTRASPGSEVIAECTWIGSSDTDEAKDPAIADYNFSDVTGASFGDDLTGIYFQAYSSFDSKFEVEVVRHWLLVPTISVAAFIPLNRLSVNVPKLMDVLDMCYSRVARFDLKRSAIRDDTTPLDDLKGVWKGVKSLFKLPGSLWQTMQSGMGMMDTLTVLRDVVRRIPPEHFNSLVSYLVKYSDQRVALKDIHNLDLEQVSVTSSSRKR